MKKTTLITTLALVVIVALALSTATFAWYSAGQASVKSTALDVSALAPTNADLRIAHIPNIPADTVAAWNSFTADIGLTAADELSPCTLVKTTTGAPSALADFAATNYRRSTLSTNGPDSTFGIEGTNNGVTIYTDTFKIANISAEDTEVKGAVAITGIGNSISYNYALFIGTTLVASRGNWSATAQTTTGTAAEFAANCTALNVANVTATVPAATTAGAVTPLDVQLFIWLDGTTWYDTQYYQGNSFEAVVTISAATSPTP